MSCNSSARRSSTPNSAARWAAFEKTCDARDRPVQRRPTRAAYRRGAMDGRTPAIDSRLLTPRCEQRASGGPVSGLCGEPHDTIQLTRPDANNADVRDAECANGDIRLGQTDHCVVRARADIALVAVVVNKELQRLTPAGARVSPSPIR